MLGEETSLAETVTFLGKPVFLVGVEPERLTLTLANSIPLEGPDPGKTGQCQEVFCISLWVIVFL
jgi:hypothetical protein